MIEPYTDVIRPFLFQYEAERTHAWALGAASVAGSLRPARWLVDRVCGFEDSSLEVDLCGMSLPNPIGLAAGYDKSGTAIEGLSALGFGHLEIGSVSIDASEGNPAPRLFRLPEDRAVVVHYGLQNDGAAIVQERLAGRRTSAVVGTNIVKTNRGIDASPETADAIVDEYVRAVKVLAGVSDYLTLNLSCPNTEDGRDFFADPAHTRQLMEALKGEAIGCPVFLKVSPLGGDEAADGLLEAVNEASFVSGFIHNLSPGIDAKVSGDTRGMVGALAGRPVSGQMNECLRRLYVRMDRRRYSILSAGGVATAQDAYDRIRLGASSVQLLTALVYEGPCVVRRIKEGMCELLKRDGFSNVAEAVGVGEE